MRTPVDPIDAKMEEYRAVRAEILASINAQQSNLRFGSAIVLAMIIFAMRGAIDDANEDSLFPLLVLLLAAPMSCYIAIVMWIGELWRMMRAGEYVEQLEREINQEHFENKKILNWENWRRSDANSKVDFMLRGNYWGTLVLFFGGALFSILIGTFLAYSDGKTGLAVSVGLANIVLLTLVVFLTRRATRRFR